MATIFREAVFALALLLVPPCLAQVITVRLVNGKNGAPVGKAKISIGLLYTKGHPTPAKYAASLLLTTDVHGDVHFTLPQPAPTYLSASVSLNWRDWRCPCMAALPATGDVIRKGILEEYQPTKSAVAIKASPGEIVFVARRTSFLEWLLYPIMKE